MADVAAKAHAKKVAAAFKEGGKKGQDLAGMSALGGVKYYHLSVEEPQGDLELLQSVLDGLNVHVDEEAEERKGGAGDIGKFVLSAGEEQLVGICHVPKELADGKLSLKVWVSRILEKLPGGSIVYEDEHVAKVVMKADQAAGVFPLKARDEAISWGFALFKELGLVPDKGDSDSDDVNYAEAAGVEW